MKALSSKRSFSRRRKIIIAVIILLIAAICTGLYFYNKQQQDEALKKDQEASKTNKSSKKDIINSSKTSSSSSEGLPKNSTTTTSDQIPTNSSLSVNISSTSQSGGLVRASAQTNGSGTCVFLYQPGDSGKPVTRQVDVSSDSCSVSISQNEFAYLGSWKLTVTYYNNGSKVEASQNVTIN